MKIKKQKIRKIRETLGKTQQHMADLLGVSRATYIKKEQGLVAFSIGEALKIAEFLNVDLKNVNWLKEVRPYAKKN